MCYGAHSWEGICVGAVEAGLLEEMSSEHRGGDFVGKGTECVCRVVSANSLIWQMSKRHCWKIKSQGQSGYSGLPSVGGLEMAVKAGSGKPPRLL